jgi:hypothetical protein
MYLHYTHNCRNAKHFSKKNSTKCKEKKACSRHAFFFYLDLLDLFHSRVVCINSLPANASQSTATYIITVSNIWHKIKKLRLIRLLVYVCLSILPIYCSSSYDEMLCKISSIMNPFLRRLLCRHNKKSK